MIDDFELERIACLANKVPYHRDVRYGRVRGLHLKIGNFIPSHSEAAVEAVVRTVRADKPDRWFYSYKEYLREVARGDRLQTTLHREFTRLPEECTLTQEQRAFALAYSLERYTPDLRGYLRYLEVQHPELAEFLHNPMPALVPEEPRRRHTYVVATTGAGKTELLKGLIHGYLSDEASAAVVVIDPAGEFVEQVARWREFLGSDRLVYLKYDLRPAMSPTINPFEIWGVDPRDTSREAVRVKQVVAQQLLSALREVIAGGQGSNLTLNMEALLMPCILTLLDRPGSTLVDLKRFMDDEKNADLIAFGSKLAHYPSLPGFFQNDFKAGRFGVTKGSISTKLQTLFTTGIFLDLTCAPSTVMLEQALQERKVILIDVSKGTTGAEEGQAFGRLIVAMLQGIALRRAALPESARTPTHLIVDECHNFVTESIRTILLEARKYALHLTLCQQEAGENMSRELAKVVLGMTNVKCGGRAEPGIEHLTARLFPVDPDDVRGLDVGEFFIRLGNAPTFRVSTRTDLLGRKNAVSETAWNRCIAEQVRRYYRPVDVVYHPAETTRTTPAPPDQTAPPDAPSPPRRRRRELI